MMTSTSARPAGNFETLLGVSRQALRDGDADTCRQAAKSALDVAQEGKDLHQEARAHLSLALADRMLAQSRRAQLSGQRAAFLFQLCGDNAGEAEALAVLAYTLSVLGRNEEAIEAALLSVKLSEQCATEAALANCYTYLGIAYSHCSGFQEADHAFNTAIQLLEKHDRLGQAYFPRLQQRAMESMRVFHERYYTGELPKLGRLSQLRLANVAQESDAAFADTLRGARPRTQTMRHLLAGLEFCWLGSLQDAQTAARHASAGEGDGNLLYRVCGHWLRAEIGWAAGDWVTAGQCAQQMIDLAIQIENEQFVSVGYLLLSQILVAQGRHGEAQEPQRLLRRRERFVRSEAIKSRNAVIEWQLKVRANHDDFARMESEARRLERLSFEDALTGLPNRRKLEQHLPVMLRQGVERDSPLFLAFIDIDRFKSINDRFSHQIGDEVLKCIALNLRSLVRDGDLFARIAGDEFIIAFQNMDSSTMSSVKERIRAAISGFDWTTIHADLRVSASVGVVQAQLGDTVDSLVHRSDVAMYADKTPHPPGASEDAALEVDLPGAIPARRLS